jgi:hypothetical protein
MAKKYLHFNRGCVYFHRVWRLPELVQTDLYGYAPGYVIVREEVGGIDWFNENGDVRRKYEKIFDNLDELPEAACDLVTARSDLEYCKTVECADDYADAERKFMDYVFDLRSTEAKNVGTFVAEAYEQGVLLGDLHHGNVGLRRHNLRSFGVPTGRNMVVADVGDQGQPVCPSDRHPKVRVLNNPYHPRHPANMAHWAAMIPVL